MQNDYYLSLDNIHWDRHELCLFLLTILFVSLLSETNDISRIIPKLARSKIFYKYFLLAIPNIAAPSLD